MQLVKPEPTENFSHTGEKNFLDFVRTTKCVEIFVKGRTEYRRVEHGVRSTLIAYYEAGKYLVDAKHLQQWNARHTKHMKRKAG